MTIETQIIETWQINHRTNILLMDNLTQDSLLLSTSKRGGEVLVINWLIYTIESLKDCHILTTELITGILQNGIDNDGKVKGFKRGVVQLLGYFIHHEAHHRGNILLTLKLCGFKLPVELRYGI